MFHPPYYVLLLLLLLTYNLAANLKVRLRGFRGSHGTSVNHRFSATAIGERIRHQEDIAECCFTAAKPEDSNGWSKREQS